MQFQNTFPVSSIFANILSDLVDDVTRCMCENFSEYNKKAHDQMIANNTFDDFLFFFNFPVMPFSYF